MLYCIVGRRVNSGVRGNISRTGSKSTDSDNTAPPLSVWRNRRGNEDHYRPVQGSWGKGNNPPERGVRQETDRSRCRGVRVRSVIGYYRLVNQLGQIIRDDLSRR